MLSGPEEGTSAAVFEPPVFRNAPDNGWTASGWADSGSDTSTHGVATGPPVAAALNQALVFDVYMVDNGEGIHQPFAFDFYAFDGNTLDFSAHVAYDGNPFNNPFDHSVITEPDPTSYGSLAGSVPEPGAFIIWSLLGGLGVTVSWRRRRRA